MKKALKPYLTTLEELIQESPAEKKGTYIHPKLKNLGAVSIVLIREAISPVTFRNAEQEITDIAIGDDLYVRGVPNKFKYIEKGRGLQILRFFNAGGRLPQNKTVVGPKQKPSEAFDLNTLVFGDSSMQGSKVLPVKAAVNYSDALSVLPKDEAVDETFHNRAAEDGTLYDAENKKNSENLFSRHYIEPGSLMVQVLSTRGRLLPQEGLDHLLLSIGFAGAYGGQTSVTGTNIRTHFAGIYADKFEKAISSPYELVKSISKMDDVNRKEVESLKTAIHKMMEPEHELTFSAEETANYLNDLMARFESKELQSQYLEAGKQVGEFFDGWFGK